jgi:heme-degrading monooxygenase HmoA
MVRAPRPDRPPVPAGAGRIASFHLVREPAWRTPVALARLGTDRLRLHGTPGLRFARLLGTGRGSSTAPGADLARTALFAVWDSPAALDAVEAGPLGARMRRTRERGGEVYAVRLALVSGRGRWAGHDVLDGLDHRDAGDGPLAVLTRAVVRPRAWHRFAGVGPAVSDEVGGAPGLLAVVGVGEAPVGLQATFSLWRDTAAMRAFARADAHRAVVRRTRREAWYGEELFARFSPVAASGTWDGRDPLAGPLPPGPPGSAP